MVTPGWAEALLAALGAALLVAAWVDGEALRALTAAVGAGLVVAGALVARGNRRARRSLEHTLSLVREVGGGAEPAGEGLAGRVEEGVAGLVERVRGEERADAEQREFERAMIQETPSGLLLVGADGRVRTVNVALRRLLPVVDEPVGLLPIDACPIPELQALLDDVARSGRIDEREITVGPRDLILRGVPLRGGRARMAQVLEITSVRRAERARREFVANVSHELRTPVTALVGYAESLADEPGLPAGTRTMVDAIQRNALRLQRLVQDVLELSRIEARARDLPLSRQALGPLVEDIVDHYADAARDQGVALTVTVPEGLDAMVHGEALDHALGNLVDNAVKYTPRGGRVRVEARREGDRVVIDVIDDGPGIDPVHHPRIFERFYRVDPSRSRAIPGTGLGLAIVKHLCSAMGGEVSVASAAGEGSTFSLRLPAAG